MHSLYTLIRGEKWNFFILNVYSRYHNGFLKSNTEDLTGMWMYLLCMSRAFPYPHQKCCLNGFFYPLVIITKHFKEWQITGYNLWCSLIHWKLLFCFLSSIFHLSSSLLSGIFYILEIFQTALRQVSGECSSHEIIIPLENWIYLATTHDSGCCRIQLSHEISCSVILNSLCISQHFLMVLYFFRNLEWINSLCFEKKIVGVHVNNANHDK